MACSTNRRNVWMSKMICVITTNKLNKYTSIISMMLEAKEISYDINIHDDEALTLNDKGNLITSFVPILEYLHSRFPEPRLLGETFVQDAFIRTFTEIVVGCYDNRIFKLNFLNIYGHYIEAGSYFSLGKLTTIDIAILALLQENDETKYKKYKQFISQRIH